MDYHFCTSRHKTRVNTIILWRHCDAVKIQSLALLLDQWWCTIMWRDPVGDRNCILHVQGRWVRSNMFSERCLVFSLVSHSPVSLSCEKMTLNALLMFKRHIRVTLLTSTALIWYMQLTVTLVTSIASLGWVKISKLVSIITQHDVKSSCWS